MRKTLLLSAAASAMLLTACGITQAGAQETVVVPGEQKSGISVSGTGEITGTPDTLTINLGVSVRGDTVQAATAEAAEAANSLLASLTSNGIPEDSITTTDYSIFPEYDYRNDTQVLLGYRVNNTVRVKISDVDQSGNIIDDATAAAGDTVKVNGISFSIEDDAGMVEAAREAAWNDARAKAEQLAQLSGRELGPVISITETVSRPPVPVEYARLAAADASTPISPGTATVSIQLSVEFSFGA